MKERALESRRPFCSSEYTDRTKVEFAHLSRDDRPGAPATPPHVRDEFGHAPQAPHHSADAGSPSLTPPEVPSNPRTTDASREPPWIRKVQSGNVCGGTSGSHQQLRHLL